MIEHRHRFPLCIENVSLVFREHGPGLFDGILTEFKLIIMKIETAIVARPRFRRVLGKLNCTARERERERERIVRGERSARGSIARNSSGKQLGATNFQFNRSSE